ncbi:hypothetical protein [Microbacterium sp. JZ101]
MSTTRLAALSLVLLAVGIALVVTAGGPPRLVGAVLALVGLAGLITLALRLIERLGSRGD